ncbi:MAG TPA: lytic murein transglycosylase [Burkholderiales bacterium]|nr:lytic murein transglycosylase [Burkholderiales bacterium]
MSRSRMKWAACVSVALLSLATAGVLHAASGDFETCLDKLRSDASAKGIATQTFDRAMTGITPDQSVLDAMDAQPEFTTPIWDYLAGLVDDERIADGRAKLAEWAAVLAEAELRFGVDRHTIVAVWGVESDFGKTLGGRPLVRSLATVSCFGSRQRFFRGELMATLRILQSGDMPAEALVGSWAGAFGQTQFMPTTYQRLAVDFDGDGRRDIVGSVPDALGSTANFLARAGWVSGQPWGYEVMLPLGYDGPAGRRNRKPLADWSRYGIRRIDGSPLSGTGPAALLLPAGTTGPAFIVFRNFDAIYSYNAAESYALAIAHLADRLRGGGPLQTAWPTDDPGLSRAERRQVQARLIERGFDIGKPDGMIGQRTRAAIAAFQASAGLTPDGRPGARVLQALRQPTAAQASAITDGPPAASVETKEQADEAAPR